MFAKKPTLVYCPASGTFRSHTEASAEGVALARAS